MRILVSTALVALVLALAVFVRAVRADTPPPPPPFRVVVHPKNAARTLDRRFVQDVFLKKVKRWPGDKAIHPLDLVAASPVRQRFSEQVIRRNVAAVRRYWQQKIFGGHDVPPPELTTDAEVIAQVLKNEGAIGYVSGAADVSALKEVQILE